MNDPWTLGWLFSEAGAGWVFGIVSLIGSLLGFLWMLRSKKKPKRVVCRELDRISLVEISENAKEKIAITFEEEPVNKLAQLRLEIFNSGSEVIQDIALDISFGEDTRILDFSCTADPENLETRVETIESNCARMLIPFLNPVSHHSQKVVASIVCDGDVGEVKFVGGGAGWSVRSVPVLSKEQRVRKAKIALVGLGLSSLLYLGYFSFLVMRWGIKPLGAERDPNFDPLSLYLSTLVFVLISVGLQLWLKSRSVWPFSKANS